MTRTTGALKRLGVAGVALATIGTGLIAAVPSAAYAAPGDVLTLTPDTASGSAGTCEVFTITVTNGGAGVVGRVVDVIISERVGAGQAGTETQDFAFCTSTGETATTAPTQAAVATNSGTGPDEDQAEFTTGPGGVVRFGVVGTGVGTADITAFLDEGATAPQVAGNDTVEANETSDTSVYTVTAGGSNNVATLTADPATQTAFPNSLVTIRVTARNASGDPVEGITPEADITAGPNNAVAPACDATDNDGVSRCTYTTGANTGTDTVVIFENQTDPDNDGLTGAADPSETVTAGLDANEPSTTATVNIVANPTGLQVDLTCGTAGDANQARTSAENCINPISDTTEAFTARVTAADGSDAGTERDVVSGITVDFTVVETAPADAEVETASPASGTTGSDGTVTTQLRNPTVQEGDVFTVTATIRGQDVAGDIAQDTNSATGEISSDSGTKTFRTAAATEARFVTITPTNTSTVAGQFQQFTATVTNVNGERVSGVTVTFEESGPGRFANGSSSQDIVTNAQGIARIETTSTTAERGAQTVTATLNSGTTDCELAANDPVTGNRAGNCVATATNTFTAPPVTPGPDTNPNPNPSDTAIARITLNVTSGRITAGNAPFLFGIVSDRNGNPLANRDVTILEKKYNTASYTELQTASDVTTNARGEFRVQIRPERQTAYVARATGTSVQSDASGSTGRAVVVQVHNRINIATPAGGATAAGRALQIRGDLDPNYASVRIGVAALRNGRYTYITQGITAGDGSFVINARNLPQGSYALVVYTSARQGNLYGSASRAITAP